MELTNIEINDDFPLMISLDGKSIWKKNDKDEIIVDQLLDRQEDGSLITSISCTELKPSVDKNKLLDVLKYFFSVCDEGLSPQCMWRTNDCDYISLLVDYDYESEKQFENAFNEIIKQFPELKQSENFIEEIPNGKTLLDMVSCIDVAYPTTWTVEYNKEKKKEE